MSVLIAIAGPNSAIIATDSRRIESGGTFRDDFGKTFRPRNGHVIGGHTGLLEFSGRTVPAWIDSLPDDCFISLDSLVTAAKVLLESEMSKIDSSEVGFEHRMADIVLVGDPDLISSKRAPRIMAIVLRPDPTTERVVGKVREFSGYCATGDDTAKNAVLQLMKTLKLTQNLPTNRLKQIAISIISRGINQCGTSRSSPEVRTCGGPAALKTLMNGSKKPNKHNRPTSRRRR
jgi:hypothetical protein